MNTLETLKPQKYFRVMDLVEESGHDISDWSNFNGGQSKAASNPKYCYEWAFYQPTLPVVLNLWHSELQIDDDGLVYQELNMRNLSSSLSAIKGKKHISKRAFNFDEALKHAYRENLPIRVVVCEGSQSDVLDTETPPSQVDYRKLDSKEWSIASYDMLTGKCRIHRKASSRYIDQHTLSENTPVTRIDVKSKAYIRQRAIRDQALKRADGICEYCGTRGFLTTGGHLYLETHHITPLSEGGSDTLDNLVSLCPNHHKLAHYGKDKNAMKVELQRIIADKNKQNA